MENLESRSSEEVVITTEATGKVGIRRELNYYYLSFIEGDKGTLLGVPPHVPDFKRSDALKSAGYKEGDIVKVKITVTYRISPKIK